MNLTFASSISVADGNKDSTVPRNELHELFEKISLSKCNKCNLTFSKQKHEAMNQNFFYPSI